MKIKLSILSTFLSLSVFAINSSTYKYSETNKDNDCAPPKGLKIEEANKTSLTISFENSPSDTRTFEVRAFRKGKFTGSLSGAESYAGGKAGENTITIKNLSGNKEYDLVIRSLCHPGGSKNAIVSGKTTNKDKKIISFKKELKSAKTAALVQQYFEATQNLNKVKPKLALIRPSEQSLYYYIQGKIIADTNKNQSLEVYKNAMSLFNKAEKLSNSADLKFEKKILSGKIEQIAFNFQKNKTYNKAAEVYEYLYNSNPNDTIHLYNAANNAVNYKNYDTALKQYNKLVDLGFTGIRTIYQATDVATGKVNRIESEEALDVLLAEKRYAHPKVTVTPSQKGNITKNIALIYYSRGELDKAEAAFAKAKSENPNDKYIKEVEAQMLIDIAYQNSKKGKIKEAIQGYTKALRVTPNNAPVNKNLASLILQKDTELINTMNNLSRSKEDQEKYKKLSEERTTNLANAAFYLEQYISLKPDDKETANSLYQIYNILKSPKATALKAKYGL